MSCRALCALAAVLLLCLPSVSAAAEEGPAETEQRAGEVPPWWEADLDPDDAWKGGLRRTLRTHVRGWAVPMITLGSIGLSNLSIGLGLSLVDPGAPESLVLLGAVTTTTVGLMSIIAFPTFAGIGGNIARAASAELLYKQLRKSRRTLGWVSFGMGMVTLIAGIAIPFTYGVAAIGAAGFGVATIFLGHASLACLVFEREAESLVEESAKPSRFGALPRRPAPPRLLAVSPLGVSFSF